MPRVKKVEASLTPDRVAKLKKKDPAKYAKLPNDGAVIAVEYDFGTAAEVVNLFGAEVVEGLIYFAISHPIASKMRDALEVGLSEGKPKEQVQREVQATIFSNGKNLFKPKSGRTKMSAPEKEAARIRKIEDPAKRKAEIEAVRAQLAALEKGI